MKIYFYAVPLLAAVNISSFACGDHKISLHALSQLAVADDAGRADEAIRKLRAFGPEGLKALLEVHAPSLASGAPTDPKLRRAIDIASGQRDGHVSRLFWFTDLEQAKEAAQKMARPILSLHLLGRLDEELSCANSRFFRIALYSNSEISHYLRENFVLHWQSVRPAPRITVDFGDGRRLERTITGNSIHYVLAPDGKPVEALPGLYGPKAFMSQLVASRDAAMQYAALEREKRGAFLCEFHAQRLAMTLSDWATDLATVSGEQPPNPRRADLEARMSPELWRLVAARYGSDSRLDPGSRALIRAKNPPAIDAGRIAPTKMMVEDPLLRAMREFERSMAEDTLRNEYLLHTQIHEWFTTAAPETTHLARLNNRVYSELFLAPATDPWLGLNPANAFTALESGGVSKSELAQGGSQAGRSGPLDPGGRVFH